jgi:enamine deaminase RidA (YjgF/YER057c/UK114 family)
MAAREAPATRRVVNPWGWQDAFAFAQAHEVTVPGRTIYCAGQASVDEEGRPLHEGDMRAQVKQALDNLEAVLDAADARIADLVRLVYYTTDVAGLLGAWDAAADRLGETGLRPASTLVGVSALAFPELLVEIEATAVVTSPPSQ